MGERLKSKYYAKVGINNDRCMDDVKKEARPDPRNLCDGCIPCSMYAMCLMIKQLYAINDKTTHDSAGKT